MSSFYITCFVRRTASHDEKYMVCVCVRGCLHSNTQEKSKGIKEQSAIRKVSEKSEDENDFDNEYVHR